MARKIPGGSLCLITLEIPQIMQCRFSRNLCINLRKQFHSHLCNQLYNQRQMCKSHFFKVSFEFESSINIFFRFALVTNLQTTLKKNLLEIITMRKEIFSDWTKLNSANAIPPYLNLSVLECRHFAESIDSATLPSCNLCSFERKLSIYESLLNRPPQESDHTIEEMKMKLWTESILDVIYQFAKKYQLPETMLGDGKQHIGQFCDLKNEILVSLSHH